MPMTEDGEVATWPYPSHPRGKSRVFFKLFEVVQTNLLKFGFPKKLCAAGKGVGVAIGTVPLAMMISKARLPTQPLE